MKYLKFTAATLVITLLALVAILYARYGGGKPYPDLSTTPLIAAGQLETVLKYPENIGNLAVAADGRVFFTVHPESRPTGNKLLEWRNGAIRPFPSQEAQGELFDAVMGLKIDAQGRLWTLDHGQHGTGKTRMMAFDLATGKTTFDYVFPKDVAPIGSFLQDLNVDAQGEFVYIADVSFWRKQPGLVVVNTRTKESWRALTGHASVMPQDWIVRNPTKDMVFFGGILAMKPGVDGIALSRDGKQLFYAAMTHDTLYSVPVDAINTAQKSVTAAQSVKAIGTKPLNDGLSTDDQGNILITDVEHGGVMRMSPDGKLVTLIRDDVRIRWADALSFGPDGYLYIADSAIPDQMLQSKAHMQSKAPYYIYRFKPGIAAAAGQ